MSADATEPVLVRLGVEFIYDTMFCEWAYVLDLDKEVLEVYGGMWSGVRDGVIDSAGRFADTQVPVPEAAWDTKTLPRLRITFPFDGLTLEEFERVMMPMKEEREEE